MIGIIFYTYRKMHICISELIYKERCKQTKKNNSSLKQKKKRYQYYSYEIYNRNLAV